MDEQGKQRLLLSWVVLEQEVQVVAVEAQARQEG
jgi:hypothetical protein